MIRCMIGSRQLRTNSSLIRFWSTKPNVGNVDRAEVEKFGNMDEWWKPSGPLKLLHRMNEIRVPFIKDGLLNSGMTDLSYANSDRPLAGLKLLDVGCGGGILTEAIARQGADATGLDPARELIEAAKTHQQLDSSLTNLNYVRSTINDFAATNEQSFDAVISSEVIEHITNKKDFIQHCVACVKPGGAVFITTINKTLASRIFGIYIAEYVLKLIPKGTHEYDKFISPQDLRFMLEELNCSVTRIHGFVYNPITGRWTLSDYDGIGYAIQAVKH